MAVSSALSDLEYPKLQRTEAENMGACDLPNIPKEGMCTS